MTGLEHFVLSLGIAIAIVVGVVVFAGKYIKV